MADVANSLAQADEEIRVALDSFKRAGRMRWLDIFRGTNTDPDFQGTEEVHVSYGLTAVLRAERHVAQAHAHVSELPDTHPAARRYGSAVSILDGRFRSLLVELKDAPSPRRIVSHLKRARKAIPGTTKR